MTGFKKLENSLIDVIKEEQAKLGFKEEKIHLYYLCRTVQKKCWLVCRICRKS